MARKLSSPPIRPDGLQLDEDRRFQERSWIWQRGSWVGFALLLGLAILGFTGNGGVFQKQQIGFSGATVELPRILRQEAADDMTIAFASGAGDRRLFIGQAFSDHVAIERMEPEPLSVRLASAGQAIRFDAADETPYHVRIEIRPLHFGLARFELGIGDERRRVSLFVLP